MSDGFFFLDANKDGFLSFDEMQQSVQGIDRKRFGAADTNHDGKLSIHEYLKALSNDFDTADVNDDGVLDHNEIHLWLSPKK
jgi:Ca2+-binding EF-hand superfamily protein